jgi:hypothetical protein
MVILKEKRLQERLVPFNKKYRDFILNKAETDDAFYARLHTHIKHLPKYAYLVQDENGPVRNVSLMDVMATARSLCGMTSLYFSFSEDLREPIGFISYRKEYDCIESMILFSFLEEHSGVIMKDFDLLVKKELPTVEALKWQVNKNNLRAIRLYDILVKPYGGKCYDREDWLEYVIKNRNAVRKDGGLLLRDPKTGKSTFSIVC